MEIGQRFKNKEGYTLKIVSVNPEINVARMIKVLCPKGNLVLELITYPVTFNYLHHEYEEV